MLFLELQGRLFTGTAIGLLIAGGAYVSTADEATFWYLHWISIMMHFDQNLLKILFSTCDLSLFHSSTIMVTYQWDAHTDRFMQPRAKIVVIMKILVTLFYRNISEISTEIFTQNIDGLKIDKRSSKSKQKPLKWIRSNKHLNLF